MRIFSSKRSTAVKHVWILVRGNRTNVQWYCNSPPSLMSEAHICPHSVDGTRCPEIVFVMRRNLSSAVCGRHVSLWCPPPPHTTTLSNPATKKLVNTKNKVSESESVKMRVVEMLSLGFRRLSVDGWTWFDSDISGFPPSEGLRWEPFKKKNPAVGFDVWSQWS